MKKRNSILIVLAVFTSLLLVSCDVSVKGKWSEADKKKFYQNMNGVQELSSLGDKKQAWIDCYFEKCEANFSSYREADSDEAGCEKLALECRKEIFSNGSVQGKWSEADKQQFRSDMNSIETMSNFGDQKDAWIECYLGKLEANYSSYFEADSDSEGCKQMARECSVEIFGE